MVDRAAHWSALAAAAGQGRGSRDAGGLLPGGDRRGRLILARELMQRVIKECRTNSKLPELVELLISDPPVTVPLGAKLLRVTPKAVDLMLAQLGGARPRELAGRSRYRAWEWCKLFLNRHADLSLAVHLPSGKAAPRS